MIELDSAYIDKPSVVDHLIDPGPDFAIEPAAMALHKASGLYAKLADARRRRALTPKAEFLSSLRAQLQGSSWLVLGQGGWVLPWLSQQRYLDPVGIATATGLEYPKIPIESTQDLEMLRAVRDAKLIRNWLRLFTKQAPSS